MLIFYFKYNVLFFLVLLITTVFQPKMHGMENAKIQHYFVSLQKTAITTLPLIIASQIPNVYGYAPGTPSACFAECITNCTDYMPPLCNLNWVDGLFLFGFGVPGITILGGVTGLCIATAIKKQFKDKERELLINSQIGTSEDEE